MNHLYLVGDQHGEFNSLYHTIQKTKLDEGDYLIVLGDFGFIWNGTWKKNLHSISRMTKGTIFVVLGNHENYDIIEQNFKPEFDKSVGNYVYNVSDNVKIVATGGVYTICGKTIFCVNGADSTDKEHRHTGISWWPQECLNYNQMDKLIAEAQSFYHVDLVCSHCTAPTVKHILWPISIYDNISTMENFMEEIYHILNFDEAYFGHYHDNITKGKYHCLYKEWVQIV